MIVKEGVCMSEKEYMALRNALASTQMEGYEITKQTEQDCVRLLKGEISITELAKEIMARKES